MNRRYPVKSPPPSGDDDDDLPGVWDCSRRSNWFKGLAGAAVLILLLILGASFGMAIWSTSTLVTMTTQQIHFVDGELGAATLNHVLTGTVPLSITLPNDLSPYMGKMYSIDCASAPAHKITIASGGLLSFWQGGAQRVATCGGAGAGFSFRVVSPSLIRLIDPRNVVFS